MSKHIFHQDVGNIPHEVQIGWDKPLQQYYANIITLVVDNESEGMCYNDCLMWSDCESPKWPMNLTEISNEVTKQGFTIPEGLLNNVMRDRDNNAVNKHYFYEQPRDSDDFQPFTMSLL